MDDSFVWESNDSQQWSTKCGNCRKLNLERKKELDICVSDVDRARGGKVLLGKYF